MVGSVFDVSVSPGNTFTQLVFTVCGVDAGQTIQWWNAATQAYVPVSNQRASATGSCATVTITNTAAPNLLEMVGTAFQAQPAAQGYTLATSDGAVFAFDAPFFGSMIGSPFNAPMAGITAAPSSAGYWLVGRDGAVFAFGGAPFSGCLVGQTLTGPVTAIG